MAKVKSQKGKAATAAGAEAKTVTVKDLAEEFGMEARQIRVILRSAGHRAPAVEGRVGFGPKAKYEWPEGCDEIEAVRKSLADFQA
jgi:hypothetical protein